MKCLYTMICALTLLAPAACLANPACDAASLSPVAVHAIAAPGDRAPAPAAVRWDDTRDGRAVMPQLRKDKGDAAKEDRRDAPRPGRDARSDVPAQPSFIVVM